MTASMTACLCSCIRPGRAINGVATLLILFPALIVANRSWLTMDYVPIGDQAADILLLERSGPLLTGHSMSYGWINGAMHPGPFFLDFRLLGQWLAGSLTGSVFGAHLVGVLLCSAVFAGLLVALLHDLARRQGGGPWTATAGVVVALTLVLAAFSPYGTLSDIFMPWVLVLPFLVFQAAAMLTLQGSSLGLLTMTFAAAALVHGYVPMLPVAGPVWLLVAVLGWRVRRNSTGRGFPRLVLIGAAGIVALFMAPLLLDMVLNPPGNPVRIVETAIAVHQHNETATPRAVARNLCSEWALVPGGLWLAAATGVAICLATGRYRALLTAGLIVGAAVTATTFLFFAASPSPLRPWAANYFVAVALLPITMGGLLTTMESGRYWRALPALAAIAAVGIFSLGGTLAQVRHHSHHEIREMSRLIIAEVPPGGSIELSGTEVGLAAGMLVDLDRFGIHACYRDPAGAWYLTRERICSPNAPADIAVYRAERAAEPAAGSSPFKLKLQRIVNRH